MVLSSCSTKGLALPHFVVQPATQDCGSLVLDGPTFSKPHGWLDNQLEFGFCKRGRAFASHFHKQGSYQIDLSEMIIVPLLVSRSVRKRSA
jgi:hypothetical protein